MRAIVRKHTIPVKSDQVKPPSPLNIRTGESGPLQDDCNLLDETATLFEAAANALTL
jgi:hypothetical protein